MLCNFSHALPKCSRAGRLPPSTSHPSRALAGRARATAVLSSLSCGPSREGAEFLGARHSANLLSYSSCPSPGDEVAAGQDKSPLLATRGGKPSTFPSSPPGLGVGSETTDGRSSWRGGTHRVPKATGQTQGSPRSCCGWAEARPALSRHGADTVLLGRAPGVPQNACGRTTG